MVDTREKVELTEGIKYDGVEERRPPFVPLPTSITLKAHPPEKVQDIVVVEKAVLIAPVDKTPKETGEPAVEQETVEAAAVLKATSSPQTAEALGEAFKHTR